MSQRSFAYRAGANLGRRITRQSRRQRRPVRRTQRGLPPLARAPPGWVVLPKRKRTPRYPSGRQTPASIVNQRATIPASYGRVSRSAPSRTGGHAATVNVKQLTTVAGAVQVNPIAINPGLATFNPSLAVASSIYQRYQFRALRFNIKAFVGSTAEGQYGLAFQMNPTDPLPTTFTEFSEMECAVTGNLWKDLTLTVPAGALATKRFLRNSTPTGNQDIKTYDLGNLLVGIFSAEAGKMVVVSATYTTDLYEHQQPGAQAPGGSDAQFGYVDANTHLPDALDDTYINTAPTQSQDFSNLIQINRTADGTVDYNDGLGGAIAADDPPSADPLQGIDAAKIVDQMNIADHEVGATPPVNGSSVTCAVASHSPVFQPGGSSSFSWIAPGYGVLRNDIATKLGFTDAGTAGAGYTSTQTAAQTHGNAYVTCEWKPSAIADDAEPDVLGAVLGAATVVSQIGHTISTVLGALGTYTVGTQAPPVARMPSVPFCSLSHASNVFSIADKSPFRSGGDVGYFTSNSTKLIYTPLRLGTHHIFALAQSASANGIDFDTDTTGDETIVHTTTNKNLYVDQSTTAAVKVVHVHSYFPVGLNHLQGVPARIELAFTDNVTGLSALTKLNAYALCVPFTAATFAGANLN